MFELLEKTLLAGIGALSLTQKKTEDLIAELQKQFNLSEEKGKEFYGKLESAARDNQRKLEDIARQEVKKACERFGVVTSEEVEKLRLKVEVLERQILLMQQQNLQRESPPAEGGI